MDNFFNDEQLEIIKNIENLYLKLVYLIKFTCIHQNNIELMGEIYKGVNKINIEEEKCAYLLNCYLKYSKDKKFDILRYIGIAVIGMQGISNILKEEDFKYYYVDIKENNIDYNLRHLKEDHINKTNIFIKDIRRNKMPKVIRKKREL